MVFSAKDSTHGFELWVTDGLSADTSMLVDLNPGSGDAFPSVASNFGPTSSSNLANGAVFGGHFIFSATYGTGNALYVTDGTTAGTSLWPFFLSYLIGCCRLNCGHWAGPSGNSRHFLIGTLYLLRVGYPRQDTHASLTRQSY